MIENMIQEYLVGLGVKIDKPGFNELNSTLNATTRTIEGATSGWSRQFVTASGIVSAALGSIATAALGVMKATADQDLAMEKLARNMMVSKDAAWEMKKATDALGESINDIALTPELMDRYEKLIEDGKNMKVGGDFEQTARSFRDLMFEFTRLKQEVSYAMTWVGYYLLKYLNRPLAEAQARFRSFNDMFIRNMSVWTEKAARALVYIINIGMHFVTFIKDVTGHIYDMWMSFPKGIKIATGAIGAFWALLKMSPLGRIITLVSALLLLIDDYYGYFEGKDALFGKYWEKLNNLITWAKEKVTDFAKAAMPIIERIVDYAFSAAEAVGEFGSHVVDLIGTIRNSPTFERVCEVFERLGNALWRLGGSFISALTSSFRSFFKGFERSQGLEHTTGLLERLLDLFLWLVGAITDAMNALSDWFDEMAEDESVQEFNEALGELVGAFVALINAIWDLVKGALSAFFGDMDDTEPILSFRDALKFVLDVVTWLIRAFAWLIKKLATFLGQMRDSRKFREFWRELGQAVNKFGDLFNYVIGKALDKLGKFGKALKCLINLDFEGAKAALGIGSSEGDGNYREGTTSGLTAAERRYEGDIQKYAKEEGLDPNLLRALIKQESSFDQDAVSSAGAIGLGQLTPETASELGVNPYDPSDNIRGAAKRLRQMFDMFDGNAELAVKHYNAGPNGDIDNAETRNHWEKVNEYWQDYNARTTYPDSEIGGSGTDFRDSTGHIRKWSSAEGFNTPWDSNSVTDTSHFQPRMVEALNALLAQAYDRGYHYTITGGSEKGYHAAGTYSHENGWKVDISDDLRPEEVEMLYQIFEKQFGGKITHEADNGHYDIVIYPQGYGQGSYSGNGFVGGNGFISQGNQASWRKRRDQIRKAVSGTVDGMMAGMDPMMTANFMSGQSSTASHEPSTTIVNNVTVGDVNVAQTNASPQQIGQAVADESLKALMQQGRYINYSRALTGGQNLV